MAKDFDDLVKKTCGRKVRERAEQRARELMADMLLAEVRKLAGFTQADLAEALGVKQPNVAKMERQEDMQITTLSRIVQALGGELEIIAHMPKGDVRITQFKVDDESGLRSRRRGRAKPGTAA